ncbi:hypothetical protein STANM309S_00937 [Streptomyces tanashiensis]
MRTTAPSRQRAPTPNSASVTGLSRLSRFRPREVQPPPSAARVSVRTAGVWLL